MTGHFFVDTGLYLLAVAGIAFVYKIVSIVAIYVFGKRLKITFIDKNGIKKSRIVKIDDDDELARLVDEIKAGKGHAGNA